MSNLGNRTAAAERVRMQRRIAELEEENRQLKAALSVELPDVVVDVRVPVAV